MKKNLPVTMLLLTLLSFSEVKSQWCVPLTVIPYDNAMPGITHLVLNTIDRTSAACENYPNNSYVFTNLSTDLVKGSTYSVSITYNIDASICPTMNLRVWIDFNQDGQLDDVGETVVSANNQNPGTYTASFSIPSTATSGTTRMRVTAKMSQAGGHTLPTPCDNPADPFGYHGEIEDYTINILDATGINSPSAQENFIVSSSADVIKISFSTEQNTSSGLSVFDSQGRKVKDIFSEEKVAAGKYSYDLSTTESKMNPGIYFAILNLDGRRILKKVRR